MEISEQLKIAINSYLNGTATDAEKQLVNEWYYAFHDEVVEVPAPVENMRELLESQMKERILQQIHHEDVMPDVHPVRTLRRWSWVAAASVILALGIGAFIWTNNRKDTGTTSIAQAKAEIVPGNNGAILTLANGSQVLLDSIKSGVVALQGGITAKVHNGALVYEGNGNEVVYNVVRTPKGREYQITLPDGTQVWLNAGSSIRYPTSFTGDVRRVEITGEAYFEVARNKDMPFKINIEGKGEVEVLGTHFNINAYADEPQMNTTLLEGSIRFTDLQHNKSAVIVPGEQVQLNDGKLNVKKNVDLESVMGWKNGTFNFSSQDIITIMRQISRWYDVEVEYKGAISHETFTGIVSRYSDVSEVLSLMETEDIKFKIENKKIVVQF
ncbi:FecR family protein [Pinibacter aurantiacus]|uniref:FecR domain-containing protein n=1 Tax=Pinibacter aurantiacus TaxID=2851599 RepID=A0A9E2SCT7_9BACT|nr:FecR family protein [Pinibacter aurantiacus]MBV4358918.1 FecR domain-containing protein [Pinibacter aurantiacus]